MSPAQQKRDSGGSHEGHWSAGGTAVERHSRSGRNHRSSTAAVHHLNGTAMLCRWSGTAAVNHHSGTAMLCRWSGTAAVNHHSGTAMLCRWSGTAAVSHLSSTTMMLPRERHGSGQ
ncbi:hypothetical protein [Amycolatopsis thermoflava]|uniref:hypothetical protein n=1 Tax=Amycolatopsis thermoflava TaxID=84480 RepID=UPI003D757A50